MNEIIELILHTDDVLLALVSENVNKAYLILFLIIMLETGIIFFPYLATQLNNSTTQQFHNPTIQLTNQQQTPLSGFFLRGAVHTRKHFTFRMIHRQPP